MKGKTNFLSCGKFHEEDVGEDRISQLPDNLIHEILSYIDMKFAVQTSILSKRWKHIWMSLPFINLNWFTFFEDHVEAIQNERDNIRSIELRNRLQNKYVEFANNVFDFRNDDFDIQMLKLRFLLFDYDLVEVLNRWILAAGNHNVQGLALDVDYFSSYNLAFDIPHVLLNCKSLKTLHITLRGGPPGRYIDSTLPSSMSLPQIRTLLLSGMSISNLELQRLFISCPIVEMMLIHECDIQMNNQNNIITAPDSLQSFGLYGNRHTNLGLPDHSLTYTTKISAPNVKDFLCIGFMTEDFYLENLSSLVNAHLIMRLREKEADESAEVYSELPTEEKEVFAKRMMKFLEAVHNVQHLTLSSGFLEVLLQAPGTLYLEPPQLCNLVNLKLEMRFTRGCLHSIAYILKISPILRILKLTSKESNLADVGEDWEAEFSLMCMFSHLKFVEIRELEGCDNELSFLRFLLEKSTVLEKVNLFFRSTGDSLDNERQVRRFRRNVRVLPTASSNIQMNFINLRLRTDRGCKVCFWSGFGCFCCGR